MSACARSCQRPPRSRTRPSRTSSQTCSVSRSRPSRSKTTASVTGRGRRVRNRRAAGQRDRGRRSRSRRRRTCASPPGARRARVRGASPPRPPRAVAPGSVERTSTPCQSAIGGTPRAKCCAIPSCPAASRLTPKSAARRAAARAAPLAARPRTRRAAARARARRACRASAQALAVEVDGDDCDARGEPPHDPAEVVAQCLRQSRSPNWSSFAFMSLSWARCATARGLKLGSPLPCHLTSGVTPGPSTVIR